MNRKAPLYTAACFSAAGFWAVYCLCMPLYNLLHWCILIIGALAAGIIGGYIAKKRLPPEPVSTGNAALDSLIREGAETHAFMLRTAEGISSPEAKGVVMKLASLTKQIFDDLLRDPGDERPVRRFAGYFLPAAKKLLRTYSELQHAPGEHAQTTCRRIEGALSAMIPAWQKQLDALFANEALDIETDISVLETMLKREGLSAPDLEPDRESKEGVQ